MLKHIWNLTFLTLENNVRNIETSSNVLSLNFLVKCFNKQLTIESTYIRLLDFIPSNMTDAERICRPGPLHDTQDESGSTSVEQEKKCLILGDSISIGYVRSMTVYLLPSLVTCINALTGMGSNLLGFCGSFYSLRSCSNKLLQVPRSKLKSHGDRRFSIAGPKLWNSIPASLS